MGKDKKEQIIETMISIYLQFEQREQTDSKISDITYYDTFDFASAGLGEKNIFVVKIAKKDGKVEKDFYELYDENGELIATVDEMQTINFKPEYLEKLRQEFEEKFKLLKLGNTKFELPEELREKDFYLDEKGIERLKNEKDSLEKSEDSQLGNPVENEKDKKQDNPEAQQINNIARKKRVPPSNILVIRENSNFYYDHPELEKNLYFYRDNDGIVRAEYIDANGEPQPSKYFEESTTSLRQETVSMSKDGNPVVKEVPYQVMRTKNLNNIDKDIRDIRMNIKIDSYGYIDIEEARQGKNGQWLSHDIEVKGRDYNSRDVNEATSIRTRAADPTEQTKAYSEVEKTGFATDGVQGDELDLIEHPDEIIEIFIKEGYQREEAIAIFNYMIGEEKLSEEDAKDRVNEEIKDASKQQETNKGDGEKGDGENDEGRTPWGDAEAKRRR